MNATEMKRTILNELPKPFKCCVSKTGLTIWLWVDTTKIEHGWDGANRLVSKLAKKLNLEEVGAGTTLSTMQRDWELIDLNVHKQMKNEANDILKSMKKFFNKWGNAYCETDDIYDIIEQMHDIVAIDEN